MSLNLIKLCVGVSSLEELSAWIDYRQQQRRLAGQPAEQLHTTRMIPKRSDELVSGGSLYWVIKGRIQARQKLMAIRPFTDAEGIRRCDLVLEPKLHPTSWQSRRAFQGWRYLKASDAPRDLKPGEVADAMPKELRQELTDLGLL